MKQILLLIVFSVFSIGHSQEKSISFEIVKVGNKYSRELIQTSFQSADLCGNYYQTKENNIVLDDGSIIKLFSKVKLRNTSNFPEDCFVSDTTNFDNVKWSISKNGIIVKGYEVRPNKSTIKH